MTTVPDSLIAEISQQINFQQKWKRVMSGAYFTASAAGILLGTTATILAALELSSPLPWASMVAGGATVVYGLEKALLFREKWAHHLSSEMELRSLRVNLQNGVIEPKEGARKVGEIMRGYAVNLPIAPHRDEDG